MKGETFEKSKKEDKKIIKIISTDNFNILFTFYPFTSSFLFDDNISEETCDVCGLRIEAIYSYIIDRLKEKGLLEKTYKKKCCLCKMEERLLNIKSDEEFLNLLCHVFWFQPSLFHNRRKNNNIKKIEKRFEKYVRGMV